MRTHQHLRGCGQIGRCSRHWPLAGQFGHGEGWSAHVRLCEFGKGKIREEVDLADVQHSAEA